MTLQIITTSDGSHSLFNPELNETYHSRHGALQESVHIFIEAGLEHYMQKHSPHRINILEVGFGTGLNALLTIGFALHSPVLIDYTSIESSPIDVGLAEKLNYTDVLYIEGGAAFYRDLHASVWNTKHQTLSNLTFEKRHNELQSTVLPDASFDIIYYDAFAPAKQPELWELPVLRMIAACMKEGGIFVTYCAKGQLKRDLRSLGLSVETLQGPPGKKEMVRATKGN